MRSRSGRCARFLRRVGVCEACDVENVRGLSTSVKRRREWRSGGWGLGTDGNGKVIEPAPRDLRAVPGGWGESTSEAAQSRMAASDRDIMYIGYV